MQHACDAPDATAEDGRVLKRRLENRHIQLISISGAVGTGLFMGSGKIIALSGTSIILVALEPDTRTALYVMPFWYAGLLLAYQRREKTNARQMATH